MKNRGLAPVFIFAILDVSFIGVFLAAFIKDHSASAFAISAILVTKNISRIITDIPLGIFADKFDVRVTFLFARICRIASVALLVFPSTKTFIVSMILYGMSMSGFYGKVDSYLYRYLNNTNQKERFTKVISAYYGMCDIAMVFTGLVASFIFSNFNYNGLIITTFITTLASIFVIPFITKNVTEPEKLRKNKPIGVWRNAMANIKSSPALLYIAATIGIGNAIVWQSHSVTSILLLNFGIAPQIVALVPSATAVLMSAGYASVYFIFKNLNLKVALFIFLAAVVALFASSFEYTYATLMAFGAVIFVFPITNSIIEKKLENFATPSARSTITSISTFASSTLNITLTLLFGAMSSFTSHHNALCVILTIVTLFLTFVCLRLYQLTK